MRRLLLVAVVGIAGGMILFGVSPATQAAPGDAQREEWESEVRTAVDEHLATRENLYGAYSLVSLDLEVLEEFEAVVVAEYESPAIDAAGEIDGTVTSSQRMALSRAEDGGYRVEWRGQETPILED